MADLGVRPVYSLEDLENQLGSSKFPLFVEQCEANFTAQVQRALALVLHNKTLRFVVVSGPTSSGKTTFARHFAQGLHTAGRRTHLLSLDDYYFEQEIRYDEAGRPDLESVDTIELSLLQEQLRLLAAKQEIVVPLFDFVQRKRSYPPERSLRVQEGDIIIIEGLHGLAAEVLAGIERDSYLGIFIMPYACLLSDNRMLDTDDIRRLRRVSRDVNQRGYPALATLDYWPMIEQAERAFVPEYIAKADIYINSFLAYEFCVLAAPARKQLEICLQQYLQGELPPAKNLRAGLFYADLNRAVKEARRLVAACKQLPELGNTLVPPNSILQEFI